MSEEETKAETITQQDIENKLEETRTNNIQRLVNLEKQGYGMNPLLQLKMRLDALTAWIIDDSVASAFELVYESMMANEISQVEAEASRLRLTQGVKLNGSGQEKLG